MKAYAAMTTLAGVLLGGCATTPPPEQGEAPAAALVSGEDRRLIESRLAAIEEDIAAIRTDLRAIATGLREVTAPREESLRQQNQALETQLDALRQRFEAAGRPPGQFVPAPGPMEAGADVTPAAGTALPEPFEGPGALPRDEPDRDALEPVQRAGGIEFISEWGRAPGAGGAGDDAGGSLKGAVAFAPRGMTREDLLEKGRELRRRFAEYENIHIQAFESRAAARAYAETGAASGGERVLVVSRHPKSGTDSITVFVEGAPEVFPWDQVKDGVPPAN